MELAVIARIRTDFPKKFGLPRQSGLIPELKGVIRFEEPYRSPDAVRGLEEFSHIWLLWGFSDGFASGNRDGAPVFSPTVRPPRLGGNERIGVWATRSPNRPNPIALSAVRLESIDLDAPDGPLLTVSGIDMTDGTPIYDIKPYLPLADCLPEAVGGFSDRAAGDKLTAELPDDAAALLTPEQRSAVAAILRSDPRPSYQRDENREYGFSYAGCEIRFKVRGSRAVVERIVPVRENEQTENENPGSRPLI